MPQLPEKMYVFTLASQDLLSFRAMAMMHTVQHMEVRVSNLSKANEGMEEMFHFEHLAEQARLQLQFHHEIFRTCQHVLKGRLAEVEMVVSTSQWMFMQQIVSNPKIEEKLLKATSADKWLVLRETIGRIRGNISKAVQKSMDEISSEEAALAPTMPGPSDKYQN